MFRLAKTKNDYSLQSFPMEARKKLFESLVEKLNNDPRVISSSISAGRPRDSLRVSFHYPLEADPEGEDILFGADGFCVLSNQELLTFSVKVPKKNQPKKGGHDDAPTDTYWAGWDGIGLYVIWEQDSQEVPFSGGHVVVDVLSDAVKSVGGRLYNQACSPGCENQFMHTVLRVKEEESGGDEPITPRHTNSVFPPVLRVPGERAEVYIEFPNSANPEQAMQLLWLNLSMSMHKFAELKNLSKRIVDLESAIRRRLSHVLSHYYEFFELYNHKLPRRLILRWQRRHWKKEVRQLLAGIWLALSSLELLLRRWQEAYRDFEDIANERDHACLFSIDYGDDVAHVQALDLKHLEANAAQVSQRLDSGQVVTATLIGALSGGLAGGILGAAATLIAAP